MGDDWHWYWGWPKAMKEIYDRSYANTDGWSMDRLAHIVWSDDNYGDHSIQYCIDYIDSKKYVEVDDNPWWETKEGEAEAAAVRQSLVDLLAIPEKYRCPPEEFDCDYMSDDDPRDYPPPLDMERVPSPKFAPPFYTTVWLSELFAGRQGG